MSSSQHNRKRKYPSPHLDTPRKVSRHTPPAPTSSTLSHNTYTAHPTTFAQTTSLQTHSHNRRGRPRHTNVHRENARPSYHAVKKRRGHTNETFTPKTSSQPYKIKYHYLRETSELPSNEVVVKLIGDKKSWEILLENVVELESKTDWVKLIVVCLQTALECTTHRNMVKAIAIMMAKSRFMQLLSQQVSKYAMGLYGNKEEDEDSLVQICNIIYCSSVMHNETFPYIVSFIPALKQIYESKRSNSEDLLRAIQRLLEISEEMTNKQESASQSVFEFTFSSEITQIENEPILPSAAELRDHSSRHLRKLKNKYYSQGEYLHTQFHLLREDFVRPLSRGLHDYQTHRESGSLKSFKSQNVHLYRNVKCVDFRCTEYDGIIFTLDFSTSGQDRRFRAPKQLIFGSLMLMSSDGFLDDIIYVVVAGRKDIENRLCPVAVPLVADATYNTGHILSGNSYDVLESVAFFEGVRPVLLSLQELSCQRKLEDAEYTVPLPEYIIRGESGKNSFTPPAYLSETSRADFRNIVRKSCRRSDDYKTVSMLHDNNWPPESVYTLDDQQIGIDAPQYQALHAALTRSFAVVQGPPGTGKTYIGLLIMKFLLSNTHLWTETNHSKAAPILLVCYTNHALDQFLEGLVEHHMIKQQSNDLVRFGNRSNSEILAPFGFKELRKKLKKQGVDMNERRATTALRKECYEMQDTIVSYRASYQLARWSILNHDQLQAASAEWGVLLTKIAEHYSDWSARSPVVRWLGVLENANQDGQESTKQTDYNPSHGQASDLIFEDDDELFGDGARIVDIDDEEDEEDDMYPTHGEHPSKTVSRYQIVDVRDLQSLQLGLEDKKLRSMQEYLIRQLQRRTSKEDIMDSNEIQSLALYPDRVLRLSPNNKWRLYRSFRKLYLKDIAQSVSELLPTYLSMVKRFKEARINEDADVLRQAKVVGMTTTAAARMGPALAVAGPKIIIVEEAAEILEGQLVASLGRHCQHLIQIGDHQQLKPSTNVFDLSRKFNLDTSLFERAVKSGLDHVTLHTQHRMRPEISRLLVPSIYKQLHDHVSVKNKPNIKGIDKCLYFIQHAYTEDFNADTKSHSNIHEAIFLVRLARYLIQQGYQHHEITILTAYAGQMFLIRDKLMNRTVNVGKNEPSLSRGNPDSPKDNEAQRTPRNMIKVTTVDNYQGEENTIILLSLVRSNDEEKIGFLSADNRICVALSRAKEGFYAVGNLDIFRRKSQTWQNILRKAEADQSVGDGLLLRCRIHPENSVIVSQAADFDKVPGGGCSLPCGFRLPCGHVCSHKCHTEDREHETPQYRFCNKVCNKVCDNKHKCKNKCYMCKNGCDCQVKMSKLIPGCGHSQNVPCSVPPPMFKCQAPCEARLTGCTHICAAKCSDPCFTAQNCPVQVVATMPCSHSQSVACAETSRLADVSCNTPCPATLPCDHPCPGRCGTCVQSFHAACAHKCGRALVCQHLCRDTCTKTCPPCAETCHIECGHSACDRTCGEPCAPCREPCRWRCSHHRCYALCSEPCERPPCNVKCTKRVKKGCREGHTQRCLGVCGERCPRLCTTCDKEKLKEIDEMFSYHENRAARPSYYELQCGHTFEITFLDAYLKTKEDMIEGGEDQILIQQVTCPVCKTPITHLAGRYANILKKIQVNIERVKETLWTGRRMTDEDRKQHVSRLQALARPLFVHGAAFPRPGMREHVKTLLTRARTVDDIQRAENHINALNGVHNLSESIENIDNDKQIRLMEDVFIMEDFGHFTRHIALTRGALTHDQVRAVRDELSMLQLRLELTNIHTSLAQHTLRNRLTLINITTLLRGAAYKANRDAVSPGLRRRLEEAVRDYGRRVRAPLPAAEKLMVIKAMNFARQGHWYKCRNGHVYAVTECGRPDEESTCPECSARIGQGGAHDNRVWNEDPVTSTTRRRSVVDYNDMDYDDLI